MLKRTQIGSPLGTIGTTMIFTSATAKQDLKSTMRIGVLRPGYIKIKSKVGFISDRCKLNIACGLANYITSVRRFAREVV